MTAKLSQILHYHPINERLAIGGQPKMGQFQLLKDAGYEIVLQLNLWETGDMLFHEQYHVTRLGMMHISIDMSYATPSDTDIRYFFEIMDLYHSKKIFVHDAVICGAANMVALYMMQKGLSFADAQRSILKGWQPNAVWMTKFEQYKLVPALG